MNWEGNLYAESPDFGSYDPYIEPMPDPVYDQRSDEQYYGDITTPPEFIFEVSKTTPTSERRSSGNDPCSFSASPRRACGNNPYGSRGCASCVSCRKRKGKVLRNR